ncbi:MAG: D-cysteine desulfhydrase family protein [Pseudomonadales bacterium]|nr:D-cysteine desulfhydrase family protein [Pseudomonadales bacterium]
MGEFIQYPDRLSLAQLPTPIQALTRFPEKHAFGDCSIFIKRDDQTGAVTSGNKVRKLEFVLADALANKATVLITCGGVQSNHCRTTVLLAAQLGLQCHLILRGEAGELDNPDGNFFINHIVGAEISCYSSRDFKAHFNRILAGLMSDYQAKGETPYFIPMGASDGTGVWGYVNACQEISEFCATTQTRFTDIVCATGSGGTLAGLIAGNAIYKLGAQVHGINVCDNAVYFKQKVRQDLIEWHRKYDIRDIDVNELDINIIDGYVGAGYAKADKEVIETIKEMARSQGLILDPIYTGKAFNGLIREIGKGTFNASANILFLHTGGVFGLYSQRDKFY